MTYFYYYFWGAVSNKDKYMMDTANTVIDKIVQQLADMVLQQGDNRVGTAAPPAR